MLNPKLIEKFFVAASIQRWNDYPRMVELVELDKQAHKFVIAYLFAKIEIDNGNEIDMVSLVEAGVFEFLRRIVVTDIRPDVFRVMLRKKEKELNSWVLGQLCELIDDIEDGEFLKRFEQYLSDSDMYKKERFIHKAASYISTKWEFSIIYQTSQFLNDIDEVKKAVDLEIEDYYELLGVRKFELGKKLASFIDLSGRLRFQKRWAQTPRVPETSVLGHMLIVALFSYFYSLKIKASPKRVENNFFCALFHDLPEALTRDIITPVKYSVSGMEDIISEYEIIKIQNDILPLIPSFLQEEFAYLLGLYDGVKDEFLNKTNDKSIKVVDKLDNYNEDKYNVIDGVALKACDRLGAFIEAALSISHGMKSKELISGKKETVEKLKEKGKINGIDFYKLTVSIEKSLGIIPD